MIGKQSGFSLAEVLVGIGLTAVMGTIMTLAFSDTMKSTKEIKNNLENTTDALLAENSVYVDFKNVDPSFNQMNILDDNKLNFYDYYPDVPDHMMTGTRKRTVTLQLNGTMEFYFLQTDPVGGSTLLYDPVLAYNVGPPPKDFNLAADLTFVSLNKDNVIKKQRALFWNEGRLLMLDTPVRVRPVVNNQVNLLIAPRSPIFVGRVSNEQLVMDEEIKKVVNIAHPETGAFITSVDQFLRNLPTMGGGQTFVRIRPVRLVRYYIEQQPKQFENETPRFRLFKAVYENGKYSDKPFMVTDGLKMVRFTRDSVTEKMLRFEIVKQKDSTN
jgi:type II secretory pathway pseudopilin PulG